MEPKARDSCALASVFPSVPKVAYWVTVLTGIFHWLIDRITRNRARGGKNPRVSSSNRKMESDLITSGCPPSAEWPRCPPRPDGSQIGFSSTYGDFSPSENVDASNFRNADHTGSRRKMAKPRCRAIPLLQSYSEDIYNCLPASGLLRSNRYEFQPLRTAQPSISRPLAAIQLPATRTAIRAQCARSRTTNAAARAIRTNTAKTSPRSATAAVSNCPMPVPFKYP